MLNKMNKSFEIVGCVSYLAAKAYLGTFFKVFIDVSKAIDSKEDPVEWLKKKPIFKSIEDKV